MKKKLLQFILLTSILFLSFVTSCSPMLSDFEKFLKTAKEYRVEYYFERILDEEFELNDDFTLKGNTAKGLDNNISVEGFYFDSNEIVETDSLYIIKKLYKRNRVNIVFNPDGGSWPNEADFSERTLSGKYGAAVSQEFYKDDFSLVRADYEFVAWDKMVTVFPSEDCEITAIWDQTYAKYTVVLKKERADTDTFDSEFYKAGGRPGELTNVIAEKFEGFDDPIFTNEEINGNGTTTIIVTYNRKRLDLVFKLSEDDEIKEICKWKDGTNEDYIVQLKYGAILPNLHSNYIDSPTRGDSSETGWEFSGWNDEYNLPEIFKESKTYIARWAKPASKYIVRTIFEKKGVPGEFDDNLTIEETRIGQPGAITTVVAEKYYPGYVADSVVQKTISQEDNETVVEVIYRLCTVTLRFEPNGGLWQDGIHKNTSDIIEATGKYGQQVPRYFVLNPKKELNTFEGWKKSDGTIVPNNNLTFDDSDTTYSAQWNITGAYVAVRFWVEDVDGNYDTGFNSGEGYDKNLTQTVIVENGKRTNVEPDISDLKYFGFEYDKNEIVQVDIPQEPDVETFYPVKVKLKRKMIRYTFDPAGGKWQGSLASHENKSVIKEGRYGSSVDKLSELSQIFRADYKFVGWDKEIPTNYDSDNIVFTAQWEYTGTVYKAQLWFKTLDGSHYEQNETDYYEKVEIGSVSDVLTVTPPSVPGFDYEKFDGLEAGNKIKADGTTVLKLYYTRKNIVYTFDANGGTYEDGESFKTITNLYDSSINVSTIGVPSKKYAIFRGWSPDTPTKLGNENKIYKAIWEDIPLTVITGAGVYTNGDISLDVVVDGSIAQISITVPYNGEWLFELYDNNNLINVSEENKTVSGAVVTYNVDLEIFGSHKIEVYASENGTVKSKFKTVKVQ